MNGDIRNNTDMEALEAWFSEHWTPATGAIHESSALDAHAFVVIDGRLYVGRTVYEQLRAAMEMDGIDPNMRESTPKDWN